MGQVRVTAWLPKIITQVWIFKKAKEAMTSVAPGLGRGANILLRYSNVSALCKMKMAWSSQIINYEPDHGHHGAPLSLCAV